MSDDSDAGDPPPFDIRDLSATEKLAGIEFTEAERRLLLRRVRQQRAGFAAAGSTELPNGLGPALRFTPEPPPPPEVPTLPAPPQPGELEPPRDELDVAFATVDRLAIWLRQGDLTSTELTELALERTGRLGPRLRSLVTCTSDLALEQARRADAELAAGKDRGMLHGIPYGAKDLLAVPGYPTTWGAQPYRHQELTNTATIVSRLQDAGAVLVAKLSLGELAMGDVWFGGKTLNPRDMSKGSSGSSAGSAAAVAAGLVPFAIGSETMGSIVSPATRCGVIGLRPSANRVSRWGAMALAWSLDKLGPLARSVADCAVVLQAIAGPDGRDPDVRPGTFQWEDAATPAGLRVGWIEEAFAGESTAARHNRELLQALEVAGCELIPMELPDFSAEPIMSVLMVEAAAAFDELVRSDQDDQLVQQGEDSWPNLLRAARFVPAVEYVQANRLRALAVDRMADLFESVDAYLCPSGYHRNLYLTNATGNPSVVVPAGFDQTGAALPWSMTVTGPLRGEQAALTVAREIARVVGPLPRPHAAA